MILPKTLLRAEAGRNEQTQAVGSSPHLNKQASTHMEQIEAFFVPSTFWFDDHCCITIISLRREVLY